ncbi:MAG: pH-response regulator protein palA/rim20 [Thelocarpon impressellum]|nr:MAG: pH-response regulator protein palA/rim20 [Thelocarpon impressellum]
MASNSNILYLPFRRSHPLSLSAAVRQYISTKYDQHPDMFAADLDAIDRMRTDAINVREPHVSGIRKIGAYAAQLVWIGGKFPIDIGADFTWYTALGYNTQTPVSQNNLRYELANILYNLASLYSQLAVALNRSTTEGLKSACNYFCLAAGVLSYLNTNVVPDMRSTPPEDLDAASLESLVQLLLAQAQECFWQKAVMDGLKDASIARLAAKVSDYYAAAGDRGVKSDSISSEWLHHMTAKHHHFAAAAQYRAACDCLEKRKYGEEVARLRDSVACVNEALKESRWLNKVVLEDLGGLRNRVQEDLKRAEKDNDMIYLIPVPPKSELKSLDRANLATVKVPKEISDPAATLADGGEYGKPLFAKLVPFAVHVAASIYAERRDRLVNHSIIEELQGLTSALHGLLRDLNLPGSLQALEKPLGLPPGLVSHAEEVRQQDGLGRIHRSMDDISKLRASDRATYAEGVDFLRSEATEDENARVRYGTDRWNRPPSKEAAGKLHDQVAEIDGYFKAAANSDDLVKTKLRECEGIVKLLMGTDRDLEDSVPSSRRATMTPEVSRQAANLRAALNEVSRLESSRRRKAEALAEKARADDISGVILDEAARLERDYPMQKIEPASFEDLFARRLERYKPDQAMLREEQRTQDDMIERVKAADAAFRNARRGDGSSKEREQALQKLENAYYKYREIISNLDVGRKFYNDLARIVTRFRDDSKNFAYQRRSEAGHIEGDMTNTMSALSLNHSHSASLQQQRQNQQPPPPAPSSPPLAAPLPTRASGMASPATAGMWTPEMGIKFGEVAPAQQAPHQQQQQQQQHQPGQGQGQPGQGVRGGRAGQWDPSRGLQFG